MLIVSVAAFAAVPQRYDSLSYEWEETPQWYQDIQRTEEEVTLPPQRDSFVTEAEYTKSALVYVGVASYQDDRCGKTVFDVS